ncbi:unnamed protein product [Dicrocoelium dendriticum]|nr:unnamed protein product [Dicrocoelium dendriticum]
MGGCYEFDIDTVRTSGQELGLGVSNIRDPDRSSGIVISEILQDSPLSGSVRIGDQILSVNGISLRDVSYRDAVQILRCVGDHVVLRIHRCSSGGVSFISPPEAMQFPVPAGHRLDPSPVHHPCQHPHYVLPQSRSKVELNQPNCGSAPLTRCQSQSAASLFTCECDKQKELATLHIDKRDNDESLGVELVSRIFVQSVAEGGIGEQAGLRPGDCLVALNGVNTAHLSLVDTANMLRRQETLLEVARPIVDEASGPATIAHSQELLHDGNDAVTFRRFHSNTKWSQRYGAQPTRNVATTKSASMHELRNPLSRCQSCSKLLYADEYAETRSLPQPTLETELHENPMHVLYCPPRRSAKPSSRTLQRTRSTKVDPRWIMESNATLSTDEGDYSSSDTATLEGPSCTVDRSEPKGRKLLFRVDPQRGTGLALVGGNLSGVFISGVLPDSLADQAGVSEGDQVKQINDLNVDGWTKEEVALAMIAGNEPIVLTLVHDPATYNAVLQSEELSESLTVRAYFNLQPSSAQQPASGRLQSTTILPELAISEGDIFHVVDTFINGVFGNWKASRVYPDLSCIGLIPNAQRADDLLENQTAPGSFRAPSAYERVFPLEQFPFPRPVVIYGPLATLARHRLQCAGQQSHLETGMLTTRFHIPPVNAMLSNVSSSNSTASGLIRLSAIKASMDEGYHCLLDINTAAIHRLQLLGIPPIVILITPSSQKQLQMVLLHYWELDRHSLALIHPEKTVHKRKDITWLAERLWDEVLALQRFRSHLITDTVPINTENTPGLSFSELDWLKNLVAVIEHQQHSMVWIGEESQMADEIENMATMNDDLNNTAGMDLKDTQAYPRIRKSSSCGSKHQYHAERAGTKTTGQADGRGRYRDLASEFARAKGDAANDLKSMVGRLKPISTTSNPAPQGDILELKADNLLLRRQNSTREQNKSIRTNTSLDESMDLFPGWSATGGRHYQHLHSSSSNLELDLLPSFRTHAVGIFFNENDMLEGGADIIEDSFCTQQTEEHDGLDSVKLPKSAGLTRRGEPVFPSRVESVQKICTARSDGTMTGARSVVSSAAFSISKTILAECAGEFGYEGGALELPEYKVRLQIPQGALAPECKRQRVFLRIYDGSLDIPSNSTNMTPRLISPVVMCGPHGLRFQTPVQLTLPKYHADSEPDEVKDDWKITLLHASANSTSADDESVYSASASRRHSPSWSEVPLAMKSDVHRNASDRTAIDDITSIPLGITSQCEDSKISILIDHF